MNSSRGSGWSRRAASMLDRARKARMVIAATTFAQAALWLADDS
jgi:hypothetical protein